MAHNPCAPSLTTTQTTPSGKPISVHAVQPANSPKIDCFYVYPTVSDQRTANANLTVDPTERSIALYQAARYSTVCRVYAPMYEQLTVSAISSPTTPAEDALAYASMQTAWMTYLHRYNDGRGVVLIGHSQGSFLLRKLISSRSTPIRPCVGCWFRPCCLAAT